MYRRKLLLDCLKLFDLVLLLASFAFSILVVSSGLHFGSFRELLAMRIKLSNFAIFLCFMVAWHFIFSLFRLYQSRRLSSVHQEAMDVTKATAAGATVLLVGAIVVHIRLVTPIFVIFFWAVSTFSTMTSRFLLRWVLKRLRLRGRNLRNVVIVGSNDRARAYARSIESRPELGFRVRGFADFAERSTRIESDGYALVANFDNFPEFLRRNVVDEVVVALPMKSLYQQAAQIVGQCREQGVVTRCLSDLFNMKSGSARAEQVEGQPVTTITTAGMDGLSLLLKRLIDFLSSCVLLTLLSPIFLIVAFIIKMTCPGPVFFVQERIGINKRRFNLIKFRTMMVDAEKRIHQLEHLNEVKGPAFKIKNDPRITGIGRFLRKASIDELPQIINVLKGDMSLVGPRPLPVRDYEGFDADWHRRRFSVKPGITCLWQCNGRSNVSFDRWMELDMEYIDNWSLWLDLKILLMTIPAVLKGSGAA
jgi:exopolysaccharide biosynthesis polyprenyl glycosylphosphotransferase